MSRFSGNSKARRGFTRRDFLKAAAAVSAVAIPGCNGGSGSSMLVQGAGGLAGSAQAVRSSVAGLLDTTIEVKVAANLIGQTPLLSRTYDGLIPGPMLRVKPGDRLRVRLVNSLGPNPDARPTDTNIPHQNNTTNIHTHGLHVSPAGNSDNSFLEIGPGQAFQYEFAIGADHPAGTYFYHPHKHGSARVQMAAGMGGALIIEGDIDQVPQIQAARELVLVLQELRIDATGQTPEFSEIEMTPLFRTVNGQLQPAIAMRPGEVVRLRVIQSGIEDIVPLQLEGHVFHQVAADGISFPAPRIVDRVLLAPGNRADVLIKAGAPGIYKLKKLEFQQMELIPEEVVATVVVAGEPLEMTLPTSLPVPASLVGVADSEVARTRTITFSESGEGHEALFLMDGRRFDPDRVDQVMTLGSAEEWTIVNSSPNPHPFHIHINPFQLVEINGRAVQPQWLDTINVPAMGSATFRIRFRDFGGKTVAHCHILHHEDLGMMQAIEMI